MMISLEDDQFSNFRKAILNCNSANYLIYIVEICNITDLQYTYGKSIWQIIKNEMMNVVRQVFDINLIIAISIDVGKIIFAIQNHNDVKHDLAKIRKILSILESIQIENSLVLLIIRAGLTYGTSHSPDDAIIEATMALNEAIANNVSKKVVYFGDINNQKAVKESNLRLASELSQALKDETIKLAFQPVIASSDGAIRHYECLLRLEKEGQLISAGPFIAASEILGSVYKVDETVLRYVIRELEKYPWIKLGMNLSTLSIDNDEWIDLAKDLLKDSRIAERLMVEITETGIQHDLSKTSQFVDTMKSLGCKVAIDDFGAGHTSFKQLKMLHADIVKIDGIFIRDIVHNYDSQLFVKTLITFAKNFGIKTIAEFIENGETAKLLIEFGIDYMQGHYFSPAVNYRPWEEVK